MIVDGVSRFNEVFFVWVRSREVHASVHFRGVESPVRDAYKSHLRRLQKAVKYFQRVIRRYLSKADFIDADYNNGI